MSKGYSIRINIGGKSFRIISDEKPEYLSDVAERVDKSVTSLLYSNPTLTYEKAAVIAALKFCDDAKKSELSKISESEKSLLISDEDSLRKQVIDYSKELEEATKENKLLHKSMSELKKEYKQKLEKLDARLHEYENKLKDYENKLEELDVKP
mgnify:FL=1